MSYPILKYPRTPHLEGSRLQAGDEDLSQVPFSHLKGKYLVIEEKVDGANTAISFDTDGTLLLQSRGHYLTGGYRERHYNLFKQWANVHKEEFYKVLGSRYIMYGEWLYAKHTVYYDELPHYFMEFDVYDRVEKIFLSKYNTSLQFTCDDFNMDKDEFDKYQIKTSYEVLENSYYYDIVKKEK